MCGNQQSTVINPAESGLINALRTQLPTNRIHINNYAIRMQDALNFQRVNTFNVRQIQFQKCQITHQILQQLLKGNFTHLQRLNLSKNDIGPIGCDIISGTNFPNLKMLQLNKCKVKDMGVKHIANAPFQKIYDLSLSDNGISDQGISNLSGKLKTLECLNLGGNKLTNESIPHIKASAGNRLVYLKLSKNKIDEAGLNQIKGGAFPKLDALIIDRNNIKGSAQQSQQNDGLFIFY